MSHESVNATRLESRLRLRHGHGAMARTGIYMIPTVVLVYHAGDRLGPEPVKFPNHLVPSFKLTCRNSQFVVPVRHAELDSEYSE